MSRTLEEMMAELDAVSGTRVRKYIRGAYNYPGSKYKSLGKILPYLTPSRMYAEPFAGSGVVLMNKAPSKREVLNDRCSGVTAFYKCLVDDKKLTKLIDLIKLTPHSREYWHWAHDTWQDGGITDVERAHRWWTHIVYSFGNVGRTFGRSITGNLSSAARGRVAGFEQIHERIKGVLIENLSWEVFVRDYDTPETLFYMDPPYLDTHAQIYENTKLDHSALLDTIFELDAKVVISSYPNELYDERDWDDVIMWGEEGKMKRMGGEGIEGLTKPEAVIECLYIKEVR